MKKWIKAALCAIAVIMSLEAHANGDDIEEKRRISGVARMMEDGAIVLMLTIEIGQDGIGDMMVTLSPDEPEYKDIIDRVGGLERGEQKLIPPWE